MPGHSQAASYKWFYFLRFDSRSVVPLHENIIHNSIYNNINNNINYKYKHLFEKGDASNWIFKNLYLQKKSLRSFPGLGTILSDSVLDLSTKFKPSWRFCSLVRQFLCPHQKRKGNTHRGAICLEFPTDLIFLPEQVLTRPTWLFCEDIQCFEPALKEWGIVRVKQQESRLQKDEDVPR